LHDFSLGIFKKEGTSTAVDVVHYAEEQLQKFNVSYPQLTCIVTDTESTMIAAGRLFKVKSVNAGGKSSWHGCIDHKL
jgi:altronate dehydratase